MMSSRRPGTSNLPARYATLSPGTGQFKPLPRSPSVSSRAQGSPIYTNQQNGSPMQPEGLAVQSMSNLNYAGRGAHYASPPEYPPSIRTVDSGASFTSSSSLPFPRETSEKFNNDMDLDDTQLLMNGYRDREDDDELHQPSASDVEKGYNGTICTSRGLANLGFLAILLVGIVFLFAGFPVLAHFRNQAAFANFGAHGLGGTNASGQVPEITNHFALIDPDTPESAYHHTSFETQSEWDLVFSDEFNVENRTFYPGDDPYWEAVDLHYYATDDLEYYDPSAITTKSGALQITMTATPNHDLNYMSGMLQSWNKFCFTGGYVEVSVSLPGFNTISGLWPAVWTMGNLGRAGYGSTTDGTWPYSYDACDVGTLANQTLQGVPATETMGKDSQPLSFLPGQRLSACTCPGEHHPGPVNPDGSFIGRSAPEIDILEAIVNGEIGQVSQSAQFAPFDPGYNWANSSADATVLSPSNGGFNSFRGNVFQESTSGLFTTNQAAYSGLSALGSSPTFATYGYEYQPGPTGYITWVNNGAPSWSMGASAVGANTVTNISARPIPNEPMYLLANLAISPTFGQISEFLSFPAVMHIDYIRVYQDPNAKNIGCSPEAFPTEEYINSLPDLYGNYNLTTFAQANQTVPKNRLIDTC